MTAYSPSEIRDALTIAQRLHEKAMQIGSANLAKAIYVARVEGRTPTRNRELLWDSLGIATTRTTWAGGDLERERMRAAEHRDRRAFVETLRVSREPCAKCGIRADIGCKHRRAA